MDKALRPFSCCRAAFLQNGIEMWGVLLSKYEPKTVTSATSRMTELSSIKMSRSESVDDFVSRIRTLAILLEDQNHVIPELLLATYAMKGLDPGRYHEVIKMFTLGKTVPQSLDEVTTELHEYESRLAFMSDRAHKPLGDTSQSCPPSYVQFECPSSYGSR